MAVAEKIELTDAQFNRVSQLVKAKCGINLHDGKKELVKGRLAKRLRKLGMASFRQYIEYLSNNAAGAEVAAMLDAISTNQTSFFRESEHFDYLAGKLLPAAAERNGKRLRIWSAGCSSGEESYTIAVTLRSALDNADSWDIRILATDISNRVLAKARRGVYDAERVKAIPPMLRSRYFVCVETHQPRQYEVKANIREMIHFARLNLMDSWPMRGPFDAIFCRNVMIYFDHPTRARLISRFYDLLASDGIFFVGHSESLTGIRHRFRYVRPTVYQKS